MSDLQNDAPQASGELQKEEEKKPVLSVGYVVGILDNGRPAFELVGGSNLNSILLNGLHVYATNEVTKLTNDTDALVRKNLAALTQGVRHLLELVQPSPEPTGGLVDSGESSNVEEPTS